MEMDGTPPLPSDTGYWFPEANYDGPLGHAPIGVMADHTHMKGHWMLSARYMYMAMDDLADGTSKLSSSQVTSPTGGYGYLVAPTRMTTQMLMLGAMYAPIEKLTLMLMLPYVWKDMQHVCNGVQPASFCPHGSSRYTLSSPIRRWNMCS